MKVIWTRSIGIMLLFFNFIGELSAQNKGKITDTTILIDTAKAKILNEVTVTATRATLQNREGKKIFSVNQSLVSEGGSAAELLQNIPTLQIDADGNVNLRGSPGLKVLVDGRPSLIAGGNIIEFLRSI